MFCPNGAAETSPGQAHPRQRFAPPWVSISDYHVPQRGTGICAISCSCAPLGHTVIFAPFPGAALRRCHGEACPSLSSSAPLGPIAFLCMSPDCLNVPFNLLQQYHLNWNIHGFTLDGPSSVSPAAFPCPSSVSFWRSAQHWIEAQLNP